MRLLRALSILTLALPLLAVGVASACEGTANSVKATGSFNEAGHFVLTSLVTEEGKVFNPDEGMVLTNVTAQDGVTLPASAGQTLYVTGDVDFDGGAIRIASYETTSIAPATVKASGSGCGAKSVSTNAEYASSSCTGKSVQKAVATESAYASSGSSCTKSASVKTASSGCSSAKAASAQTASSGCSSAKAAGAEAALVSSGSGCGSAVSTSAKAPAGCDPAACAGKATKSVSADPTAVYLTGATKAAEAEYTQVVYNVSGMTCGGCASKVQKAVQKLEMDGIEAVDVSYEEGQAVVHVSEEVDKDVIQKAITATGFTAELAEAEVEVEVEEDADTEAEKSKASEEESTATM